MFFNPPITYFSRFCKFPLVSISSNKIIPQKDGDLNVLLKGGGPSPHLLPETSEVPFSDSSKEW